MKYGLLLELRTIPEWREHYLSYKKLKRLLLHLEREDEDELESSKMEELGKKLLGGRTSSMIKVENNFQSLLESDILRINEHAVKQRTLLLKKVDLLMQQQAAPYVKASPSGDSFRQRLGSADNFDEICEAYRTCIKLRSFVSCRPQTGEASSSIGYTGYALICSLLVDR